MIKEAVGVGSNVDEAREQALVLLNAAENEEIQFEVIATPKKKILGLFGGSGAKVRAFVEVPDAPVKKPVSAPAAPVKKPVPSSAAPVQKPLQKPVQPVVPESKIAPSIAHAPRVMVMPQDTVDFMKLDPSSPAAKSAKYLDTVLKELGCKDVKLSVAPTDNGAFINISGEDLGVVIGRRGETLDALQYLSSLAANSKESGYFRVVLNTGNYREKREATLQSVARKTASQVLRTGHSRSLEPMNPYERRIIHTVVQDINGVVSNSTGEGSARRVVISLAGKVGGSPSSAAAPRTFNNRSAATATANSATSNPAIVKEPVEKAPIPPAKKIDTSSTPLYGRIDK